MTGDPGDGLARRAAWSAYAAAQFPLQRRAPFRPPPAHERAQGRRVRAAVAHAYEHVPFYRDAMRRLGLRPSDFEGAADLAKLPLVEREELQRDPEAFVSLAQPAERYVQLATDGTSGRSVFVYHDPFALFQGAAHSQRVQAVLFHLAGRRGRLRRVSIADPGSALTRTTSAFRSRSLVPSRLRYDDVFLPTSAGIDENARRLSEARADLVRGYGSYLEALFVHVDRTGMPFRAPKVVAYGADAISEPVRRLIRERFGAAVVSVYGAGEAHNLGFECEHRTGLHLNDDLYPLRIVDSDGRELPADEPGDVVVSNLVNRATVLLNYRLGDRARRLEGACPCGRTLPRLSLPEGRTDDWVEGPEGEAVHAQEVRGLILADDRWVLAFQIEQRAALEFGVRIVVREGADVGALTERISARFADRFGPGTVTAVEVVDALARTPGGKVRVVTSRRGRAPQPARP